MDNNAHFCLCLYNNARKKYKCPPAYAKRLSPAHWGWYVEIKDGSCTMDQIDAGCANEAKYLCVIEWAKQKGLIEENG